MTVLILKGREVAGSAIRRRSTCYRVLVRQQHPGSQLDRWQVATTSGFAVVFHSKLEVAEFVWMYGGKHWPRPNPRMTDEKYLEWLMKHHFKWEQYVPTSGGFLGVDRRALEVSWSLVIRGWYPDAEDIPGALPGTSPTTELVRRMVEERFRGL